MYWIEYSCGCSESGSGLPAKPHSSCPMHGDGSKRSALGGTEASLRALGAEHLFPSPEYQRPNFTPNIEGMKTWRSR